MQFTCSQCNYDKEGDGIYDWGSTQMAVVSTELELIYLQHCQEPLRN